MTSLSRRRLILLRLKGESIGGRSVRMESWQPSKAGCRCGLRASLTLVASPQTARSLRLLIEQATYTARTTSGWLGHAGALNCRPRAPFSSVEEGEYFSSSLYQAA